MGEAWNGGGDRGGGGGLRGCYERVFEYGRSLKRGVGGVERGGYRGWVERMS